MQDALDRTMQGRTVLVIAHRLSTVQVRGRGCAHPHTHTTPPQQDADKIIVVQHGQVRESGTHDQLVEAGGVYAQLVRRQLTKSVSVASMGRSTRGSSLSLVES